MRCVICGKRMWFWQYRCLGSNVHIECDKKIFNKYVDKMVADGIMDYTMGKYHKGMRILRYI